VTRSELGARWERLPHPVRWMGVASVGGALVLAGLVLMVLPGPGIPLLIVGLVILATEFAWAETLLRRVRQHGTAVAATVSDRVWRARANLRRPRRHPHPDGATQRADDERNL
jgi:hypothetical protein